MTTVKQLYALQEVDLDLDRVYRALEEAEEELKIEISIESLESLPEGRTGAPAGG